MKKAVLLGLLIMIFTVPAFSLMPSVIPDIINEFDSISPVGYSAAPVGKTILAVTTYKNMDSSTSDLFNNNQVYAYVPFGLADLRLSGWFWKSGGSDIQVGSMINLGLCGLHVAYLTWIPPVGSSTNFVIAEALFDNMIFVWGVGVTKYLGSSGDTYPFIKIGKEIGVGVVSLDGRAIMEMSQSDDPEMEISLKVKTPVMPVYGGIRLLRQGSTTNTVVDLGAMFSL